MCDIEVLLALRSIIIMRITLSLSCYKCYTYVAFMVHLMNMTFYFLFSPYQLLQISGHHVRSLVHKSHCELHQQF